MMPATELCLFSTWAPISDVDRPDVWQGSVFLQALGLQEHSPWVGPLPLVIAVPVSHSA